MKHYNIKYAIKTPVKIPKKSSKINQALKAIKKMCFRLHLNMKHVCLGLCWGEFHSRAPATAKARVCVQRCNHRTVKYELIYSITI